MENDTKKVKRVARCIQTLLETEGTKISISDIAALIKDEDLSDVMRLKDRATELASTVGRIASGSVRKSSLKSFIKDNWAQISGNTHVKDALLNAYCVGRHNKEKRQQMVEALLAEIECEG